MTVKTICATLLLMAICMQSTWAQKVLVYKADKSRIELNTSEVDSMVFVSGGNDYEKPFNLEGYWYLSERSGCESDYPGDSTSYSYNEDVLWYQEFSFSLIQGETNYYSVSWREKHLLQREGESSEDYCERLNTGDYSPNELVMSDWQQECNWLVLGGNLYTTVPEMESLGLIPYAKMVSMSYNQFTIAARWDNIYAFYLWKEPYKFYFTFTRIE